MKFSFIMFIKTPYLRGILQQWISPEADAHKKDITYFS